MENYETIKNMSIEDLQKKFNCEAKMFVGSFDFYQQEIARREAQKINKETGVCT